MDKIGLIEFGTFGIPNGFRQTLCAGDDTNFKTVKTFDLNTNAIKLFPNTRVYSIRKELINGLNTIAYTVYSFAKEKSSNRGGTFIGSSIIFCDKIADENSTIKCLNEFHNELITNKGNVDNDIIQVDHSDNFKFSKKPKDFDKLIFNLKEIGDVNFLPANKDLVVYNLVKPGLFEISLELLSAYDTIFFTKSEEVAKFVYEKQLIKLIQNPDDLEKEIEAFRIQREEERKRKLTIAIEQFQREIYLFEENGIQYIDKSERQIGTNKKQLAENELHINNFHKQHIENSKQIENLVDQLNKLKKLFHQHKTVFIELLQDIKAGSKQPEQTSRQLQEYRGQFEEEKRKFIITDIRDLSGYQNRSFITDRPHSSQHRYEDKQIQRDSKKSSSKTKTYKIVAAILFFLWISTLIFFLFFNYESYQPFFF